MMRSDCIQSSITEERCHIEQERQKITFSSRLKLINLAVQLAG